MISLLEKGYIKKVKSGSNFSYVLQDNSIFLATEYKVLQSQTNSCFVKCMKMLYNGKVQMYYMTEGLKPFASIVGTLDSNSFLTIVSNMFADIIDVKHNGFLSCQNIDISFEHIFVDPFTYKVSLVYLPLSKRIYEDASAFENELRTELIKMISGIGTLSSSKTMQFASDLSNGTLSLEDLYANIKGIKNGNTEEPKPPYPISNKTLYIVALNAPEKIELVVNKDEFVIGRKASSVDGVVAFNNKIGRVHCKINKLGGEYTISDLQSSNGTYVNQLRVLPNQAVSIKHGDIIRLANSDFQVVIK